jgi:hypothetical protein
MEGSLLSLTVAQFLTDCARMILESACPEIESDGWHSAPVFGAYMFGTLSSILEMLRDKHSSVFYFYYYYYY